MQVICSHGFGVKADSRGMFPDIAAAFPQDEFTMFDYSKILPNGDTVVAALDEQAAKLQQVINEHRQGSVLLCHSQGCIVAGLADLSKISRVILLAPPASLSMQRVINRMKTRPGSEINLDGVSKLPRSDGTTSYLPKEYLESLARYDAMEVYQKIADTKPTVIIRATEDEVVGLTNVNEIRRAEHIDLPADHNFTGAHRAALIEALKPYL